MIETITALKPILDLGVSALIVVGLILVGRQFIPRFLASQEKVAESLTGISQTLQHLPQRDEFKFQELVIGQELIHQWITTVDKRLDRMEAKLQ
ncbi:MAG: hypothetical protein U1C74_16835 [Phenylobacterium sp.]|nr:hypothetical protein [Phenylobacterium sp.]